MGQPAQAIDDQQDDFGVAVPDAQFLGVLGTYHVRILQFRRKPLSYRLPQVQILEHHLHGTIASIGICL